MRILILGGTRFVGRAMVEAGLDRGHEITLFNRGQTNRDVFPEVEKLYGDRSVDLGALQGRRWEAVIDTCGYVPRVVRMSAEQLAGNVDLYTFISSLSVYADFSQPGVNENSPVATIEDESTEEVNGDTYGALKALSEQAAIQAIPGQTLVIRPGLIVGPHDHTDRFTYWPYRVSHGGEVLAPGRPGRPVQFIDARDLARWTVRMIEAKQTGIYNATGPEQPLPMEQLLEICKSASGSDATFTWVSEEFLSEHEVGSWIELPLWIPDSETDLAGFSAVDISKAEKTGLSFRPVLDTVRATLEWSLSRPDDYTWQAGLKPEREAELLHAWRSSRV